MTEKIEAGQRWLAFLMREFPASTTGFAAVGLFLLGAYFTGNLAPASAVPAECSVQSQPRPATLLRESPEAETFTVTRADLERWAELEDEK